MTAKWFDVDKTGLAKVLSRRGIEFVVTELVSNAWDEKVTRVDITIEPVEGKRLARLVVEDDSPDGFLDLSHAWTLFAESRKKSDPNVSGRFNLGDKLVFALAKEATIETTTGALHFDAKGRRRLRDKRERGTKVSVLLPMKKDEIGRCLALAKRMIPRAPTFLNGEQLPTRSPTGSFEATLETEIADENGFLRRTYRRTQVDLYDPLPGNKAALLELGVPVVETGDRWEYDVRQKIPLGIDREHIPSGFLNSLRAHAANATAGSISDPSAEWVTAALENYNVTPATVKEIIRKRFGEKAVAADPTDQEAVHKATAAGYTVVHGGSLSAGIWEKVRQADALPRAGRIFPTNPPNASDDNQIPEAEWTPGMTRIARYTRRLGEKLLGFEPIVRIVKHLEGGYLATWCGKAGGTITFNAGRLPEDFWGPYSITDANVELILHEFGHHFEGNHLSDKYNDALCKLGAKLRHLGHMDWEN
jgi:hypothetical protein